MKRVMHEQIVDPYDATSRAVVEANSGAWSVVAPGVAAYRDWLLERQHHRCVYCQGLIFNIQVGHCEIDHILPKEPSAYYRFRRNRDRSRSDNFDDRRHTQGYSSFTFRTVNLAVTCKMCNSSKGSFDPRNSRNALLNGLPGQPGDYTWVHPHLHRYSEHISIDQDWVYRGKTDEGDAMIWTCKLDTAEVVARRRTAETLAAQSESVEEFFILYGPMAASEGRHKGVAVFSARFNLDNVTAERLCDLCIADGAFTGFENAKITMQRARDALTEAGYVFVQGPPPSDPASATSRSEQDY